MSVATHERGFDQLVSGNAEPSLRERVLAAAGVRLGAAPPGRPGPWPGVGSRPLDS